MELQINVISGLNLGIEYFEDEDHGSGIMLDLFVLRFILFFSIQE